MSIASEFTSKPRDKRYDQLEQRLGRLEETLKQRLVALGISIAGVHGDVVRIDQQLRNELDGVAAMQDTISDQLDELRDMVAEMQAEQWKRHPGFERVDVGGADLSNRLLLVLETQQRIMERQLAGQGGVVEQTVVGLEKGEPAGVKRVSRTEDQEVA